jgi:LytS/YehU family sensor histidine kinase
MLSVLSEFSFQTIKPVCCLFLTITSKDLLIFSFAAFLLAFIFFFFIYYRIKRESVLQFEKNNLMLHVAEVEMKALRAQINPHFLFNALNSIYILISNNDTQSAGTYVLKLGTLIRKILENSSYANIALADDNEVIDLYIQVERMRLGYRFEYSILIDDQVDVSSVMVPSMIIQPIVENAIWHGLKNCESGGLLEISIHRDKGELVYSITDNGSNHELVQNDGDNLRKAKRKSLGMQITRERLDVINKVSGANARIIEKDLTDDKGKYVGKNVMLILPLLED